MAPTAFSQYTKCVPNLPPSMELNFYYESNYCLFVHIELLIYCISTLSPGEIIYMFIPDRVCAAIVGMNCNILCAFIM